MREMLAKARAALRHGAADRRGSTTMVFAFSLPVMLGLTGAVVDYSNLTNQRSKLQNIADTSALAAAREFRLGNANAQTVTQAAANFANASLASSKISAQVSPSADLTNKTITVKLAATVPTFMMQFIGMDVGTVDARATAKMVGGAPICVIGLDQQATSTILMDQNARLDSPGCSVYSNSTKPNGLMAKNSAYMRAAFICTSGGKSAPTSGSFIPSPQTDCPPVPDPLLARALPTAGGCKANKLVITGAMMNLAPGTYCGGVVVDKGATVTLQAGTYVFKDGPLLVKEGSTLTGTNVNLHFSGNNAVVDFEEDSTISLTAPRSGDMAGILISEDRSSPAGQTHIISSDNAARCWARSTCRKGGCMSGPTSPWPINPPTPSSWRAPSPCPPGPPWCSTPITARPMCLCRWGWARTIPRPC